MSRGNEQVPKRYLFQRKGMTSYLFNGQWRTDKNERKYRHMSVIPFPVCEYAANHYREGWRQANISNYTEGRQLKMIKLNKINK